MRTMRIGIGVVTAALVIGTATGCSQTHEVGKSAQSLFRGESETTVQRSPAQVAAAIDGAIADVKLIKIGTTAKETKNQVETIVVARSPQDVKVQVAYHAVGSNATSICVSTGAFGNSEQRQQMWDALRARLGLITVATSPAPSTQPAPTASTN